jgi:hypothetical protein
MLQVSVKLIILSDARPSGNQNSRRAKEKEEGIHGCTQINTDKCKKEMLRRTLK